MSYNIEEIKKNVQSRLSDKRYQHILRVYEYATKIAPLCNVPVEKIEVAALLHDVAKELPNEKILELSEKTPLKLSQIEKDNPHNLHGFAGAYIAKNEFHIDDTEILTAIAFHSGRAAMGNIEKVLFLSDLLDKTRRLGIDFTDCWRQKTLDKAIINVYVKLMDYGIDHDMDFFEKTRDAVDFIIDSYERSAIESKKETEEDDDSLKLYQIYDKAFDTYRMHKVNINSVYNIRDLGGYIGKDNRKIKKNKLLRSGDLHKLSVEDADTLRKSGINCIIDLRLKDEVEKSKDINIEGFNYYNCPLLNISSKKTDVMDEIEDFKLASFSDEEAAWYNYRYFEIIDIKQMYIDILTKDESMQEMKKICDILLDDENTGILLHCRSGKDRTGIMAAIILFMLGVSKEEILNDYYASLVPSFVVMETAALLSDKYNYNEKNKEKARSFFGISDSIREDVQGWFRENDYGAVLEFVKGKILLSSEERNKLINKFLE